MFKETHALPQNRMPIKLPLDMAGRHLHYSLVLVVVALLTAFSAAAWAQRPLKPFAGEPPTLGIHLPSPSLVNDLDPSGIEMNPGTLGLLDSWSLMFHHAELKSQGRVDGGGDALLIGLPIPLVKNMIFGFGLQWLRPAESIGYSDSTKISFALSWRLIPSFALGLAVHTFVSADDPALGDLNTADFGLTLRPSEWLGMGLVVRDLFSPHYQGFPLQRLYDWEIALRPLSTNRLELGLGVRIGERRDTWDPRVRLEVEPLNGLRLFGDVEFIYRDFYRNDQPFTDVRATAGLSFNLEHIGLAFSTIFGRELPSPIPTGLSEKDLRSSYQGVGATLRLQGARRVPLFTVEKGLVHVVLKGPMRQKKMLELVLLLREIERRPEAQGLFLEINGLEAGWAQAQELRYWLKRLRHSGKKSYVYLLTPNEREYYLATAADHIFLDAAGELQLKGLALQSIFFRGTFDKIGVNPQFIRIAEFKSAPEGYMRKSASPAAREMNNVILDNLFSQLVSDLANDRQKKVAELHRLIEQGLFTPPQAKATGLVDSITNTNEIATLLEKTIQTDVFKASELRRAPVRWPVGPGIAVIVVEGDIIQGKSADLPILNRRLVGDETIVNALNWARTTDKIKAVVIRVNSGGGSAVASQRMWREVVRTRQVKPVVVSLGDVAASGGYYVACAGEKIFAQPGTLTGSIGIFSGKFDFSGLLDKLGINIESLSKGKHALMNSMTRPYTAEERSMILAQLQYGYRAFLSAVSQGRHLSQDQVHEIARGRVWTGSQAKERGLVDESGDFYAAVEYAKQRAGFAEERPVRFVVLPQEEKSIFKKALDLVGTQQSSSFSLPSAWAQSLRSFPPVLFHAHNGEPIARWPFITEWE